MHSTDETTVLGQDTGNATDPEVQGAGPPGRHATGSATDPEVQGAGTPDALERSATDPEVQGAGPPDAGIPLKPAVGQFCGLAINSANWINLH